MCGIIGTTNIELSNYKFENAFKYIFNRGPDNQNFVKENNFIFGHSRLSILDLDPRSNQPFYYSHDNKKICIVFNGEIYNFLDIKNLLLKKNYNFHTTSDTEVICAAFLEWGISCFDRFQGMWAVGIYNYSSKELIIARDRIGKKPLYYSYRNNQVYFSSSLFSVVTMADLKTISEEGLELYFALGYTPDSFTIIQDIKKLEPGRIIVFKNKNNEYVFSNSKTSIFKSIQRNQSVKSLISNAVKKRIIADVPIATLMSGGVDSTIVTTLTKRIKPNIETFFVDFKDKELSEAKWSNYLSKRNKIKINNIILGDEELLECFKDYYKTYEEPFADYSGLPSIAIFKKMSKNFKVILTGDGGDELFYGYPHYIKKVLLKVFLKINKIINLKLFFTSSINNVISGNVNNFESNYLKTHTIVTNFAAKYIDNKFNSIIRKSGSFIRGIIQYDREFNNLPEKYLVKVDRASMFSGVEVRSPFLDEELLHKVKKINPFLLFTPLSKKLFLKVSYFKLFGFSYFFAKKQGFTPPIKYLRNTMFDELKFNFIKEEIQKIDVDFYVEIQKLKFEDILKDEIFHDRFLFFYLWYINFIALL